VVCVYNTAVIMMMVVVVVIMQAYKNYLKNTQKRNFVKWRLILGIMGVECVICFQQHILLANYKEQGWKALYM
jgi:undecaprenyl pyrophosphate phosphatase UppP